MDFELRVWPGVAGLPSIDAECVAAVTLIEFALRTLPTPSQWTIVTAHDASISPSKTLPTLSHDDNYVSGLRSIVKHLQSLGCSIDNELDSQQKADSLALRHHFQNIALPLLDYHLYINTSNYSSFTYKSCSSLTPFPFGWLLPPHRYTKAENRAASLGLADPPTIIQADADTSATSDDPAAGGHMETSTSPSLLFARSKQAQRTLKEQANTTRFRMEAAVDTLCAPLDEMLKRFGPNGYLVGTDDVCSIDYLAHGYLSLLLSRDCSDASAADVLRKRWPAVAKYAHRLTLRFKINDHSRAPFHSQSAPSLLKRSSAFFTAITSLLMPRNAQSYLHFLLRTLPRTAPILIFGVLSASTSLVTLGYAAHTFLAPRIPRDASKQAVYVFSRAKPRLSQLGESGAALAALFGPVSGPFDNNVSMQQERTDGAGVRVTQQASRREPQGVEVAEVDVEVERG